MANLPGYPNKETINFLVQRDLADAMRNAAKREYTSVSNVIRSAVVRDLREKGILDEAN